MARTTRPPNKPKFVKPGDRIAENLLKTGMGERCRVCKTVHEKSKMRRGACRRCIALAIAAHKNRIEQEVEELLNADKYQDYGTF